METKRSRGRPKRTPEENRSEIIPVRLTVEERRLVEVAADGNVSAWIRDTIIKTAKRKTNGRRGS